MFASPRPIPVVSEPALSFAPGTPADGPSAYESYRQGVERLVAEGVPFEPLARAIDEAEVLAADQRAALWLLAWSLIGPDTDRAAASK
jgi:hypothetical protein